MTKHFVWNEVTSATYAVKSGTLVFCQMNNAYFKSVEDLQPGGGSATNSVRITQKVRKSFHLDTITCEPTKIQSFPRSVGTIGTQPWLRHSECENWLWLVLFPPLESRRSHKIITVPPHSNTHLSRNKQPSEEKTPPDELNHPGTHTHTHTLLFQHVTLNDVCARRAFLISSQGGG